jgi:hypothetical protein
MYAATPIYPLPDQTLVFGLRQPVIQPANGDQSVTVDASNENRLDLISSQLYQQPNAWWAIADVSGIIYPLAGVLDGTVLRAPAASRLPA